MKKVFLVIFLMSITTLCLLISKESVVSADNNHYICDSDNRILMLYGINTEDAKHTMSGVNEDSTDFIDREVTQYGFNTVRFLVFWSCIEPKKCEYNYGYLDAVKNKVKEYSDRGMKVIIDFHQDLYGPGLVVPYNPSEHDGAPLWATNTDGLTPKKVWLAKYAWEFQNLDPAMLAAQKNFFDYKNQPDLQDHYITAQNVVVKMFKHNPNVLGYDVYNEPLGGNFLESINGKFQENQLSDFYQRSINSIRNTDKNKYIFLEPQALGPNQGFPGGLRCLNDPRDGDSRLVYAPHIYPLNITAGKSYNILDQSAVRGWIENRDEESEKLNMPIVVGEIGGPESAQQSEYLQDIFGSLSKRNVGYLWWSNMPNSWGIEDSNGNRQPKLKNIAITKPLAIYGIPKGFKYNFKHKTLVIKLQTYQNKKISTEVFMPFNDYPNGFNVNSNHEPSGMQYTCNKEKNRLYIYVKPSSSTTEISITPKQ